jgi:hypothetical protein
VSPIRNSVGMTNHGHKPGDEVLVETSKAFFEATIVNYTGNGTYNVRSESGRVYLVGFRSIRGM